MLFFSASSLKSDTIIISHLGDDEFWGNDHENMYLKIIITVMLTISIWILHRWRPKLRQVFLWSCYDSLPFRDLYIVKICIVYALCVLVLSVTQEKTDLAHWGQLSTSLLKTKY